MFYKFQLQIDFWVKWFLLDDWKPCQVKLNIHRHLLRSHTNCRLPQFPPHFHVKQVLVQYQCTLLHLKCLHQLFPPEMLHVYTSWTDQCLKHASVKKVSYTTTPPTFLRYSNFNFPAFFIHCTNKHPPTLGLQAKELACFAFCLPK